MTDTEPTTPNPKPSERLQTLRTLAIGLVIAWVVLVGAWAIDKSLQAYQAAKVERNVEEARKRLASVGDLADIFNEVSVAVEPSVVKIDVRRSPDWKGRFGESGPEGNSGSGVIVEVDAEEQAGYIVTNEHVVDGAAEIVVTLHDGRRIQGRVIGSDLLTDVAVVRIQTTGIVPAIWGDSDGLRKGDFVLAFGSPFGFVGSMTQGVVSALNRERDAGGTFGSREFYTDYIQTDAAINPGNSGGPLTNVQGQIIGINTAIFTRTGDFSGIGFAIPSNQAKRIVEDIRQRGRAIRGWLGADLDELGESPEILTGSGASVRGGVVVTQVYRNTPAHAGGLRPGDIITAIDDTTVDTPRSVRNKIAFAAPGTQMTLGIYRDGESIDMPVKLGEQPPGDLRLDLPTVGFGLTLISSRVRTTDGSSPAVLVETVAPDSPAARAGLRPRDQILAVDGVRVDNAEEADAMIRRRGAALGVKLRVSANNRTFDVFLTD